MQIFTSAADISYVEITVMINCICVSNSECQMQLLFLHLYWMYFPLQLFFVMLAWMQHFFSLKWLTPLEPIAWKVTSNSNIGTHLQVGFKGQFTPKSKKHLFTCSAVYPTRLFSLLWRRLPVPTWTRWCMLCSKWKSHCEPPPKGTCAP